MNAGDRCLCFCFCFSCLGKKIKEEIIKNERRAQNKTKGKIITQYSVYCVKCKRMKRRKIISGRILTFQYIRTMRNITQHNNDGNFFLFRSILCLFCSYDGQNEKIVIYKSTNSLINRNQPSYLLVCEQFSIFQKSFLISL